MRDDNKTNNMANEILIIGVGSAGVIAADKMDLSNSKKLFVDTDYRQLEIVKSGGDKLVLQCKDFGECSGFCRCYSQPGFCKEVAEDYEGEIRSILQKSASA